MDEGTNGYFLLLNIKGCVSVSFEVVVVWTFREWKLIPCVWYDVRVCEIVLCVKDLNNWWWNRLLCTKFEELVSEHLTLLLFYACVVSCFVVVWFPELQNTSHKITSIISSRRIRMRKEEEDGNYVTSSVCSSYVTFSFCVSCEVFRYDFVRYLTPLLLWYDAWKPFRPFPFPVADAAPLLLRSCGSSSSS